MMNQVIRSSITLVAGVVIFGTVLPLVGSRAQAASSCQASVSSNQRCCTPDLTPTWWCAADQLTAQVGGCAMDSGNGVNTGGTLYTCDTVAQASASGVYEQKIKELASNSACAAYSWKNRGRAPAGYIEGMALSFGRNLCRLERGSNVLSSTQVMSKANTGVTGKDVLAWYAPVFNQKGFSIDTAGALSLRSLFSVQIGLGMRESSGNYCTGWDTSAGSNRASSAAEAGPFQTSYDSFGASPELQKLYSYYQANPDKCWLNVFKQGASCSSQSILGTGAGATYQRFIKSCPAFAADSAAVTLRVLRTHFGPIIRKQAEVNTNCGLMLNEVRSFIDQDPANACADLL